MGKQVIKFPHQLKNKDVCYERQSYDIPHDTTVILTLLKISLHSILCTKSFIPCVLKCFQAFQRADHGVAYSGDNYGLIVSLLHL